jgi:hypothetical protein
MQLEGTVFQVFAIKQVTQKLTKCEFVLLTDEAYPQHILFEAINKMTEDVIGLIDGQRVVVEFKVNGRPWTSPQGETRYFNSLQVTAIKPQEQTIFSQPARQRPVETPDFVSTQDDLPF